MTGARAAIAGLAAALLAWGAATAGAARANSADHGPATAATADLALIVLPATRLIGLEGEKATVTNESGPVDAVEQAYRTIDPDDTAAGVVRDGFVVGFQLGWAWRDGPVLNATSTVLRFRDASSAAAFVAKQARDNARFLKKPIPPLGVAVEGGKVWKPDGFGELPAAASAGTLSLAGKRWQAGGITFRAGALVVTFTTGRTDDGDLQSVVEANGRLLRDRLLAVQKGSKLDGPPPLRPRLGLGSSAKPTGAPPLDRLAVGVADLPGGGIVRSSGWITTPGIQGFDRSLRVNVRPVGRSYLTDLEVILLQHDDLPGAKASYTSMVDAAFFSALIERTARLATTRALKLRGPDRTPTPIGDEASILQWQLETPIGPARIVAVIARVGMRVEALVATGSAVMVHPEDIAALLRKAIPRLGNGTGTR